MTSAVYDFKSLGAILAKASVLKVEPKQDTVKPAEPVYRPEEGASHVYDYADGAFPADYSCMGVDSGSAVASGGTWVVVHSISPGYSITVDGVLSVNSAAHALAESEREITPQRTPFLEHIEKIDTAPNSFWSNAVFVPDWLESF